MDQHHSQQIEIKMQQESVYSYSGTKGEEWLKSLPQKATEDANSIHCTGGKRRNCIQKASETSNYFSFFFFKLTILPNHLSVGAFVPAALSLGLSFANLTPERGHMLQ